MSAPYAHFVTASQEWPWLPTRLGGPVLQHPVCRSCGLVKAIGSDRPLKDGGLVNRVAALSERFTATGRKVTEAQCRLIHKALQEQQADDGFAYKKAAPLALFVDVYSRHTDVPRDVVLSHMERL